MKRIGWGALLVVLAPGAAGAQLVEGSHRLSMQGTALSSETSTITVGANDVSFSRTTYGLFGAGMGAGYHYAISETILVGARVAAANTSVTVGNDSATEGIVWVLPELEIMLSGGPVRPFLAPGIGMVRASAASGDQTLYSWTSFAAGASAGVHLFVTDQLSIDPGGGVYFETGSGDVQGVGVDRKAVVAQGTISLSGWIGAKPSEATGADIAAPVVAPPPSTAAPGPTTAAPGAPPVAPAPPREVVLTPVLAAVAGDEGQTVSLFPGMAGTGRIRVVLSHPKKQASFSTCFTISVTIGGKRFDFPVEQIRTGKVGAEAGIAAYVGMGALKGDGPFEIDGCGEHWSLPREKVATFLSQPPPAPPPPPPPTSPSPAPETPAAR